MPPATVELHIGLSILDVSSDFVSAFDTRDVGTRIGNQESACVVKSCRLAKYACNLYFLVQNVFRCF